MVFGRWNTHSDPSTLIQVIHKLKFVTAELTQGHVKIFFLVFFSQEGILPFDWRLNIVFPDKMEL